MKEKSLISRIVTSVVIFLIAVVVVVVVAVGLGALGVPLWPFILLVFFYTSVDGFAPEKLKGTAVSGAIGIFVGMSQGIFAQLTGSTTAGFVCFGILAIVFCSAFIMGNVPWSTVFGILIMTIMTLFSLEPCIWAGIPAKTDMGSLEAFLRVIGSYAIGVILFVVLGIVMKNKAATAQ